MKRIPLWLLLAAFAFASGCTSRNAELDSPAGAGLLGQDSATERLTFYTVPFR